jgi:hypothetical protein
MNYFVCFLSRPFVVVNACLPDERDEFARLNVVYGQIMGWGMGIREGGFYRAA